MRSFGGWNWNNRDDYTKADEGSRDSYKEYSSWRYDDSSYDRDYNRSRYDRDNDYYYGRNNRRHRRDKDESIFKHIFNQVRNFHKKSTFYKNYNRFWVIENSSPVIEKLSRINAKKNAKDISTYDFSTLYTKLQHDDLIKNLNDIVDFAFKGGKKKKDGNRKYITVTKFSTYWSQKKKGNNSFSKQQIKLLITHLIKETYFQIGNLLFKQCIGIPMGIDPAPFWANLYLYVYEFRFIKLLMSTNKGDEVQVCCLFYR